MVMYTCETWTVKKAEHIRIDVFELWCWRRFLKVPWTARRLNQCILKEISPESECWSWSYSIFVIWYEQNPLEKSLMLGKIEDRRRRRHQRMKWLNGITDAMDMNLGKLRERVDREVWHAAVHGVTDRQDWATEQKQLLWLFVFWKTFPSSYKAIL